MPNLTAQQIVDLYKRYRTPKNVINHMLKVALVARGLCEKLERKGFKINTTLVEQSALLHDLVRVCDFRELNLKNLGQKINSDDLKVWLELRKKYGEMGHVKAAAEILKKLKHIEVARLIEKHAFLEIDNLKTLEEKVLYYADKRVDGATVVSLKKRFEKGHERNARKGDDRKEIKEAEAKVFALEKELKKLI